MTRLINIQQVKEWKEYVKRSEEHDFYHTWYYHSLDKSGDPLLFVYEEGENFIALPLLRRRINNSNMRDLTSVYGYTGPISNQKFEEMEEELMENFKASFLGFLKTERNISVFSRLHPFINQGILMERFGGVYKNGKTVAIDLTVPIEEQRAKYQKDYIIQIKKLRNKGYFIKQSNSLNDVKAFVAIYTENMKRVGATGFYLFDLQYFINLLQSQEFICKLVLVYGGTKPIAGSLITCTNKIMQSHLVATSNEFLKESPAKFLTDEISILGRELGMKYYHLGGGLGFKEDSLFKWKAGFSDMFLNYNSWRYIADEHTYNQLLDGLNIDRNASTDFFPLYRSVS